MFKHNDISKLFPSFEKALLDELSNKALLLTYKEGEELVRTGQYFRSMLIIMNGLIKIFREDEEGNEYLMYYLQPGQACALSMICAARQEPSQLKAIAAIDATIITVPPEYMDQWMRKYPGWYSYVLESYKHRFMELLQTIDHIAFRNMDERLFFYLKRQQQIFQTDILTVNYTTIAQELSSSREVISRLMKKLSENKMIQLLSNQQIKMLNADTGPLRDIYHV